MAMTVYLCQGSGKDVYVSTGEREIAKDLSCTWSRARQSLLMLDQVMSALSDSICLFKRKGSKMDMDRGDFFCFG